MKYYILLIICFATHLCYSQKGSNQKDSLSLDIVPVSMEGGRQYILLKRNNSVIDTLIEVPAFGQIIDYHIISEDTVSYIKKSRDETYFFYKLSKNADEIWSLSLGVCIGRDPIWLIATKEELLNPPTYHLRGPDTVIRRSQGKEEVIDVEASAKGLQIITSPKK